MKIGTQNRVGIFGSGDVAKSLARGFLSRGQEVKLGTRDAAKLAGFVKENGAKVSAGSFAETAAFGEVLVLATLGSGTQGAIDLAGAKLLAGKTVIDATNPLAFAPNAPPTLYLGTTDSLGEQVQRWLPDARVVKAFNTVGNAHFVDPKFQGGPPDMFICGNHDGAKSTVGEICKAFGWGVADVGGIEGARALEPMCLAWVYYGLRTKSWAHAFKLLHA